MKIHTINRFFAKMAKGQIKYRWGLILLAIALTAFGVAGMFKVQTANSRDSWFDDTEQIEIATKRFEKQFGNNENIGVLIQANDVFHPEVLKAIHELGKELLDQVPYSDEITSLTEIEISIGDEEGIRVINPFEDGIPTDPNEIEAIRELFLSRGSLKDKLFSEDCTETWLSLSLVEYPDEEVWKKETNLDPLFQVGEAAIAVVTNPKWQSDLYTLKPAGMPYSETEERDFFGAEAKKRVLAGFVVMLVLLIVFLRSLRGVFVPVFTTIMGIVVVFGFMGWVGISVDANMMTLPILLGMALSVGYSIHLVIAFKRFFNKHGNRKQAVIEAVEETGWPIFFTAVTTMGSVMSFAAAGILTIQWLGFTCAAVVFADYLFVITLIPALMSFGKNKKELIHVASKEGWADKMMQGISRLVINRKKSILVIFLLGILVLVPGVMKMQVNMDIFQFMGTKIPYVNRLKQIADSQLGSYLTYNITIKYDEIDKIKDPAVLRNFEKLTQMVGDFEFTKKNKEAARIFSILDIIKEMNQTLNGDDPAFYTIPDNQEMIAQLLFLYEISGGTKTFEWIDEDYSMLRAQVQIYKFSANEMVRELNIIREKSAHYFPGAEVDIIGSAIQFAELNKKIVSGELASVGIALVVIGVLLILVFGSVKTGLIGMIPNVSPLIVLGGYMGFADSPLDMMTMTIMPMILGIAVDDTIHFINHIKYEFEKHGNYQKAVRQAFGSVGKTLGMTTIVLSATFAMYMFSLVANMARIGFLAALGLTVALVIDYLITPSLIMITKPFGEETNPQLDVETNSVGKTQKYIPAEQEI